MFPLLIQGKEMNGGDITSFIVVIVIIIVIGICILSLINDLK